jgi:hypothetical protein
MSEPRVDIEDTKDNWSTHADWPLPGSSNVDVYLQGDTQDTPGTLGFLSGGRTDTLRWTDLSNQSEATALNIAAGTTQNNRRVFLSPPLTRDLRFSGTPRVILHASLDKPQSNLSAMLVDYGPSTQITRSADGISTPAGAPSDCWGPSSTRVGPNGQVMDFDPCYGVHARRPRPPHQRLPPVTADGGVGGTVPATLALTLGAPESFPAIAPGVDRTYETSTTATVTSSAGDATLSTDGGRLSNGAFTLAEPLQVTFSKATWNAPTSNENVTIGLEQHIGANEPLRTGNYTTTLTFTLSTTSP